jgi:hypothetical protein
MGQLIFGACQEYTLPELPEKGENVHFFGANLAGAR